MFVIRRLWSALGAGLPIFALASASLSCAKSEPSGTTRAAESSRPESPPSGPVPDWLERKEDKKAGYEILIPKDAKVTDTDKEIGSTTYTVESAARGQELNVLVSGYPHENILKLDLAYVEKQVTMTGSRKIVDKGEVPGGGFFAVTEAIDPADTGAAIDVSVFRMGKKNLVSATCYGSKQQTQKLNEICKSLQVTK